MWVADCRCGETCRDGCGGCGSGTLKAHAGCVRCAGHLSSGGAADAHMGMRREGRGGEGVRGSGKRGRDGERERGSGSGV